MRKERESWTVEGRVELDRGYLFYLTNAKCVKMYRDTTKTPMIVKRVERAIGSLVKLA